MKYDATQNLTELIPYYSFVAEQLRRKKKPCCAEVAEALVLFIKSEVGCWTEEKATFQRIEDLMTAVNYSRDMQIDTHFSRKFRLFLMKEFCGGELSVEMRAKFCEVLGVQFTTLDEQGQRRRITQKQLMKAHKKQKSKSSENLIADDAYLALSKHISCRSLVDQRWRRFKNEIEGLLTNKSFA